MEFDWQNVAVLVLVVAAGAYLARLAWRSIARRRSGGCGGCGTCPSNAEEPTVVELGQRAETAHASHNGANSSGAQHPGRAN